MRNLNISIFDTNTPTVSEESNIISIKNLVQVFNKGTSLEYPLFENFSLDIPDLPGHGQLISIMGGSGCGKSCLLKLIAGITEVESGEITVCGKPLKDYGHIPMVFQAYSNFEWMTVLDNVKLPLKLKGISDQDATAKATELIKLVGLEEHINKYAKNTVLSGGQLQRISIARCLASGSEIILLDEATGALDIKMKREIQDLILKIFYESSYNPTILNVTHSPEEAVYLSNRIIFLQPKPCRVYETLDIHFTGEETMRRGSWVLNSSEFIEYSKKVSKILDEVCK